MTRHCILYSVILLNPSLAVAFDRPIPQAQSATAEFWFAFASLALIAALVLVARLVSRR